MTPPKGTHPVLGAYLPFWFWQEGMVFAELEKCQRARKDFVEVALRYPNWPQEDRYARCVGLH